MRDLLSDEFDSVAGAPADRLVPASLRRIGGAVLFLGVIGAMGLWSYRLGTRDAAEVPVIKAMEGPARIAPEDPGGIRAAHQGLEVNAVLAGQPTKVSGSTRAAPEPAALADEDEPEGALEIAGTPIEPETPAAAPAPAANPAAEASGSIQNELAAMVASVTPAVAAVPDGAAPGARPKGRPSNLALARAAPPAPEPAAPSAPAPSRVASAAAPVAKTEAREVASVAPGARLVQLGAYDSEAQAREAWGRLVARDADLLGTKSLYVERATSNARVFYRLRVAGFDNADQTRRMCEALRGRGIDCIPVTLQ